MTQKSQETAFRGFCCEECCALVAICTLNVQGVVCNKYCAITFEDLVSFQLCSIVQELYHVEAFQVNW